MKWCQKWPSMKKSVLKTVNKVEKRVDGIEQSLSSYRRLTL